MPNTRTFLKSFSSGEISPEMFGRIDDNKYQQGAATMRNFIAKPQGPAQNRAGFSYVAEVKYSTRNTRLIPFRFNVSQTMVIEMGHEYFRFHTQGLPLLYSDGAAWSNTTAYSIGDIVKYNNKNYYAKRANTNVAPHILGPLLPGPNNYWTYSSTTDNNIINVHSGASTSLLNTGDYVKITVNAGTAPDEERVPIIVTDLNNFTYETATNVGNNSNSSNNATLQVQIYDQFWYELPSNMTYEIPSPYLETELFDIKHIQSADILTLVHPSHAATELKRLGATKWALETINFAASITPPSAVSTTVHTPTDVNNTNNNFQLNTYVVTAVAQDGISESVPSAEFTGLNNLFATGAYNQINFSSIGNAYLYRIYKKQGGIFGFIGEVQQADPPLTTNTIRDENIAPDFSMTPPQYDEHLVTNFPSAVTYYEQRRVFAATNAEPQTIFMTKSGTESNMSFKLPILDDDRIKFKVAARESNKIKHIVPLTQLLFLTEAAEWRVTSVNSDAITPTSVSVKPQSYIGANDVQPVIVNNSIVYIASRGGHARELGYSFQANGFITGDLSIRAAHLFDGLDIVDMQLAKAPIPIVYMVSTSGKLLGFTYVPEQQVGAWHQHDTDGTFESVTTVAEDQIDAVYCVIKRTINGNTKRYIERMGNRDFASQRDSFFVDSGKSYNGTNKNTSQTVKLTSTGNYTKNSLVTILFTQPVFKHSGNGLTTDLNDAIVIVDGNETYRCDVTFIADAYSGIVKLSRDIPSHLQNTPTSNFEIAEKTLFGLSHLVGKTVSILADGAVHPTRVVDSNGSIVLNRAASVVHIGLPYVCDLETLPLMLRAEAGGQGRVKNINHAWLRVNESSGIFAGPTVDKLVEAKQRTTEPYGVAPSLKTKDIKLMLTPTWSDNGQIFIRQTDPLPLTVVGITLEVSIGG